MLVHDAQYDEDEYADRVGWGHSTLAQTIAFATMCEVGHLVLFHHDPSHDDEWLDRSLAALVPADLPFAISIATEGLELPVTRERV
jgi:ribonuclease BN (tRNA processing enzyme)